MFDSTIKFKVDGDHASDMKTALREVYAALQERGLNPIDQIVGYILSEDPTYITSYKNARTIMKRFDRDDILQELLQFYLDN